MLRPLWTVAIKKQMSQTNLKLLLTVAFEFNFKSYTSNNSIILIKSASGYKHVYHKTSSTCPRHLLEHWPQASRVYYML